MEAEKKNSKKILITAVIVFILIIIAAGSVFWIREKHSQREKRNTVVPETIIPEPGEVPVMENTPDEENEKMDLLPELQEEAGEPEENPVTEPEETAQEMKKFTQESIKVRDITVCPGTEAVFNCYEKDAAEYRWEFYSVLDRQWESVDLKPEFEANTESDDLGRQVSCLRVPGNDENDLLSVRCTVVLPEDENIISEGCLHLFTSNAEKVSVQPMEAEAGEYLSSLELNAVITDEDGKEEEISGFQAMAFCVDQDEKESTVYDEENSLTTETYTKVFRESPYYLVEEGEQTIPIKLHMKEEIYNTEIKILGKDTQPPELEEVRAEYKVSGKDVESTKVKIYAAVTDNYSRPSELVYAFGNNSEADKNDMAWTDKLPMEVDITENGTYYFFAKDTAGNIGTEELEIITVDMKAPVIEDIVLNKGSNGENQIEVTASDKTELEYSFHLQGGSAENWQKESVYPVGSNGEYVVRVRDAAGNVSEGNITVSSIDTTAPVIKDIYVIAENSESQVETSFTPVPETKTAISITDEGLSRVTDNPVSLTGNNGSAITSSGSGVSGINYGNRSTSGPAAAGTQGAKGDKGDTGAAGVSSYVHIRYSQDDRGTNMKALPDMDTKYIGVYSGSSKDAPSTADQYVWSQYRGSSSSIYIRYSGSEDGADMTETPVVDSRYIGICNSMEEIPPSSASSYTWMRFTGSDGNNSYLHVKYSEDGVNMTDIPNENSGYVGICVSADAEAPTDSSSYNWCRISYGKEMGQMQQTIELMQTKMEELQNEIEELRNQVGEPQ